MQIPQSSFIANSTFPEEWLHSRYGKVYFIPGRQDARCLLLLPFLTDEKAAMTEASPICLQRSETQTTTSLFPILVQQKAQRSGESAQ